MKEISDWPQRKHKRLRIEILMGEIDGIGLIGPTFKRVASLDVSAILNSKYNVHHSDNYIT